MKLHALLVASVMGLFVLTAPLSAQDAEQDAAQEQSALEMRADQVVALVNGELEAPLAEVFTADFLTAVPEAQLATLSQQLVGQFGRALAVERLDPPVGTRAELAVRMERTIAKGGIVIAPADGDRIAGLNFTSFEPVDDSAEKIAAELSVLSGEVSAYFGPLDGGEAVISIQPDAQFAVGSTFKLYVLAALAQDVALGRLAWDDQIALTVKSYPSGMMQDWPKGAPVTLQTLASLMIAISDNTATDQLIALLGRDRVAKVMADSGHNTPDTNRPFLTTRELFLLKAGNDDRLAAFKAADAQVRAQILDGMRGETLPLEQVNQAFASGPVAIDIEWFASARDLSSLFRFMRETADPRTFDLMTINPNVPAYLKDDWSFIGFKGGSEPGVLNYTYLLTDTNGRDYVLSLSWNNPDANVEHKAFDDLVTRILSLDR
ncbi:MAG: serine hydrolase [Pseudomonadota bacterium]